MEIHLTDEKVELQGAGHLCWVHREGSKSSWQLEVKLLYSTLSSFLLWWRIKAADVVLGWFLPKLV